MTIAPSASVPVSPAAPERAVVLLVDDQLIIGEAVRRIVAAHADIEYHFCQKPEEALPTALRVKPTVILQDLVMPGVDGLDLVSAFRAQEATRLVPLVVLSSKEEGVTKAEAFARGANDYIVKLPDPLELVARLRYHSRGYTALLERNAAFTALHEKQEELAAELAKASAYVQTLLPRPWPVGGDQGPVAVDWRFVPSASLGGDSLDYFWLDDEHLAFYVLDVSGHGVGPALLSVSVMTLLRNRAGGFDRRDPAAVMTALNDSFRMDRQGGMYFTIWYGVYSKRTRRLLYSGGGHPPVLMLADGPNSSAVGGVEVTELESPGLPIGVARGIDFETVAVDVPPGAELLVYSDGAIEVFVSEGQIWGVPGLREFFATRGRQPDRLDALMDRVREIAGGAVLPDDCSVVLMGMG